MILATAWKSYRFPLILLASILTGCLMGFLLGPKAKALKPLGDLFLNLMFTVVVPLVFVSISSAVANIGGLGRLGRVLTVMLLVFAVTGIIASVITIIGVKIMPPSLGVAIPAQKVIANEPLKTADQVVAAFTVSDFGNLLSRKNMLPLIVFAILFGIAVKLSGAAGEKVARGLEALSQVTIKLVSVVMWAAPVGLGAYFAYLTGVFGPELMGSYKRAMLLYYPLAFGYFFVFFPIYAWMSGGRTALGRFRREIITPAITALGTGSSVATIPANLLASARIGVPRDVREMTIPIGATIHMDGSCLSAVMKIAFLFGIYGMPFEGLATYATCIAVALLSGMVMAGIPGGGFIGEMLIVSLYGFPPEALPILAVLGTLVDPPATMVNSTGDTVCSMLIARILEGPGWLNNSEEAVM